METDRFKCPTRCLGPACSPGVERIQPPFGFDRLQNAPQADDQRRRRGVGGGILTLLFDLGRQVEIIPLPGACFLDSSIAQSDDGQSGRKHQGFLAAGDQRIDVAYVDRLNPHSGDPIGDDHHVGALGFDRSGNRFDRMAQAAGRLGDLDGNRIDGRMGTERIEHLFDGRRRVPFVADLDVFQAVCERDLAEAFSKLSGIDAQQRIVAEVGHGRLHRPGPRRGDHHHLIGMHQTKQCRAYSGKNRLKFRCTVVQCRGRHRLAYRFGHGGGTGSKKQHVRP